MSRANLKLSLTFEFDLAAPDELLGHDHGELCRAMHERLGAIVLQGMPTITAKQLGKGGVSVLSHHHHLDVSTVAAVAPARDDLIAAAPHLTDDELLQLARRASGKLPAAPADRLRVLRRHALAFVGEFRVVPCVVHGPLSSGKDAALPGRLNLTNGSVLLDDAARHNRLQQTPVALRVEVPAADVALAGSCVGHTLSGPVVEVALAQIAGARDALIGAWMTG